MSNMTVDIILPVTTPNSLLYHLAQVAIRTCAATIGEHDRLHVMLNNTPNNQDRKTIQKMCKLLGAFYKYVDGPYSNSKFWNRGLDETQKELIAWANQDCIFFPGWCEAMKKGFKDDPTWFALWPYSFHTEDQGLAYCMNHRPEDRIIETHHPATLLMMQRKDGFRWDENLSFWEMDRDIMEYAKKHQKRMGLVRNARVDHFGSTVSGNINFNEHFGEAFNDHCGRAKSYVINKYGPT